MGEAGARAEGDTGAQTAGHGGETGETGRVVAVGVQVDGAAVFGGDLQDGRRVAGGVGVQVGAAADDCGAHLQRVAEHGEVVGSGDAGEEAGDGDGGQVGEAAQGPPGLQDGLQGGEPLYVADADVGAQGGGPVAELEEGGLGGAALDVLGAVGGGPRAVGPGAVGGQGGVAVGMGFGRGGEQEVAAQVDAGAPGGEAARGADGLDTAAAEAYVDGAAVGETGAGQDEGGGGIGGGRVGAVGRVVVGPPRLAVRHRAPGRGARSHGVGRA